MVRQRIEYFNGLERTDVEVLVDHVWCPGEVRMQTQLDDGIWKINVQWQAPVPGRDGSTPSRPTVRLDTAYRSAGRS